MNIRIYSLTPCSNSCSCFILDATNHIASSTSNHFANCAIILLFMIGLFAGFVVWRGTDTKQIKINKEKYLKEKIEYNTCISNNE